MTTLRVQLTQTAVRVGDLAGNTQVLREAMTRAEAVGADVLLTPEMSVTGYPCEDLLAEHAFVAAAQDHTRALAAGAAGTVTVVGAPFTDVALPAAGKAHLQQRSVDAEHRVLRNVAAVLHDGQLAAAHAKTLLPNYGVFDDVRHFGAGVRDQDLFRVHTADGPVTFAILVCEDVWNTATVARAAAAGAQAVLVINASPYTVGKPAVRLARLREAAVRTRTPIAYVNFVGGQDELVYDGGSFVVDADGQLLAKAASFVTDELVVDIPVAAPTRPDLDVVDLGPTHPTRPPIAAPRIEADMEVNAEVYTALVTGFRDYCQRAGVPKIVLGLSGGIDSALAATIAVDALGADAVWGIGMPGPYSSQGSVTDARELADNLGIRFDVVPIKDPYLEREHILGELLTNVTGTTGHPVAWENLQARLRGTTLMTLANAAGALVCTTGNRSESAVGYFTLYGDSCGALNPIGDLFKTSLLLDDGTTLPGVYGLSRWRNEHATATGHVPPIPESTLTKPASAELAPDQQDSDSLPPYEVLDPLLLAFLEGHHSAEDLTAKLVADGWDRPAAAGCVNRVLTLVDRSEFKRRQVAFRIKISQVAFGRDRRMPLANHWSHASATAGEPVPA